MQNMKTFKEFYDIRKVPAEIDLFTALFTKYILLTFNIFC